MDNKTTGLNITIVEPMTEAQLKGMLDSKTAELHSLYTLFCRYLNANDSDLRLARSDNKGWYLEWNDAKVSH